MTDLPKAEADPNIYTTAINILSQLFNAEVGDIEAAINALPIGQALAFDEALRTDSVQSASIFISAEVIMNKLAREHFIPINTVYDILIPQLGRGTELDKAMNYGNYDYVNALVTNALG